MNAVTESRNQTVQTPQSAQAPGQDGRGYIIPPANIVATQDGYIAELEMPGVSKDGIEVTVEGNELRIIGRRQNDLPDAELCYCESAHADYRRVFELGPDVDTSRITAEMKQGVLRLFLPKSEKAKPKQIEVKVA